jgi:hypothetical protein
MHERSVGCRVQVYWEGETEWFDGAVDAYSPERGYYVKYDDGEEQWEVSLGVGRTRRGLLSRD